MQRRDCVIFLEAFLRRFNTQTFLLSLLCFYCALVLFLEFANVLSVVDELMTVLYDIYVFVSLHRDQNVHTYVEVPACRKIRVFVHR
jgi:hypothetical protein